ncbi:MAG TPA: CsgG/HfaB family protein [Gemmatimonadaceae bacterium]|nr:CsgG/HfaB family protein [Gemmatimonadaceae bacterium]HRQ77549.1 CsgG/HfaB family protein [Gemmatimonadaceae bacterium]
MLKQIVRATAVVAFAAMPLLAQDDTRPTVAVLPFVNSAIGAAQQELAPLSKGIADLLIIELSQNPGIRLVERENIEAILNEQNLARDGRVDDATAARIGRLLGAKHIITGSFVTDRSGTMVVTLKSIDVETSRIAWTHMDRDQSDNFLSLVSKVGRATNAGLKLPELTPQARQTSEARTQAQARVPFRAVMMYSRAISAQDAGNRQEALTLFNQVVNEFPEFEDAKKARERLQGAGTN